MSAVDELPKSLAERLAAVMGQMQRLPKTGWNAHHRYKFASDADVSDTVRALLAEQGVCFAPSMVSITQEPRGDKGVVNTRIDWNMVFHGPDASVIQIGWCSEANDSQDKGINKAATSGVKYFLLKTFLISTGDEAKAIDDDPDHSQDGGKITDDEKLKRMRQAVEASGKLWDNFLVYVEAEDQKPADTVFKDTKSIDRWYRYIQTSLHPKKAAIK